MRVATSVFIERSIIERPVCRDGAPANHRTSHFTRAAVAGAKDETKVRAKARDAATHTAKRIRYFTPN